MRKRGFVSTVFRCGRFESCTQHPPFLAAPRCADGPHAQPGHRVIRVGTDTGPGLPAEEGGALRWRTINVLCGVEFCVKQNLPPRHCDAACDVDARLTAAGVKGVRGRIPRPGGTGKRDSRKVGAAGKRLRRGALGARGSNRPVSEIRIIRAAKVEESGHRAPRAHAAGRRENVNIYSRQRAQNLNIYSGRDG